MPAPPRIRIGLIVLVITWLALPAQAEMPDPPARPIEQTAEDFRAAAHDLDARRSSHHRDGEGELHRRALAVHRAMELARGLLVDYQAELLAAADRAPADDESHDGPAQPDSREGRADSLRPGDGWDGDLPPLAAIGDDTAHAIARWNVVPDQTFDGPFEVGVVAFHHKGIERVAFSVDGGQWLNVHEPTPNPRSGTVEYWVQLDAGDLADGEAVEVRAIAYPVQGRPRVLAGPRIWRGETRDGKPDSGYVANGEHSLTLFARRGPTGVRYVSPHGDDASGDGTRASPFATTDRAVMHLRDELGDVGGSVIRLEAGEHVYGRASNRSRLHSREGWLTLEPAEGVGREEVVIVDNQAGHGFDTHRVRLHNLTVRTAIRAAAGHAKGVTPAIWFDGCLLEGQGPDDDVRFAPSTSWVGGIYATDTTIRHTVYASLSWAFARNLLIHDISGDAFRSAYHVVNCEVRNLVSADNGIHRDVSQWFGTGFENVIVYGLTATENVRAQPLFSRRNTSSSQPDGSMDNVALVGLRLHSESHSAQWQQRTDHMVMRDVSITGGKPFLVRNDSGDGNDLMTEVSHWLLEDVTVRLSWSTGVPVVGPVIFRNVRTPDGELILVEREGVEVRE